MHDLEEQLARFGSHFEQRCDATMPPAPAAFAPHQHRGQPLLLVGIAAMTVAAVVAVGLVVRSRPTDHPTATSVPETSLVTTESTSLSTTTTTPPPASVQAVPESLPFDTSAALAVLPHLVPGWLPDGAVEGAASGTEFRSGSATGWAQIYVAPDRAGRLIVSSGGTYGGHGDGAASQYIPALGAEVAATQDATPYVAQVASSVTLRADRIGWNLDLPDGYALLGEGPISGVVFARTWTTPDTGTVLFSVSANFQGIASAITGDTSTTRTVGNLLATERTFPSPVNHSLTWAPAPGFLASVSTTDNHADDLERIAANATDVADDQWQALLASAVIDTQTGDTRGGDPTTPDYDDLARYLPTELPAGFDPATPAHGWAEPGNPTVGPGWEQTWIGTTTHDPAVVTVSNLPDPIPDGADLDINGQPALFTQGVAGGNEPRVLVVARPDGTTLTVTARRLSDNQIVAFARTLVARADGNGYDTTETTDLQPFSDALDGGAPREVALGWIDGVRTITVLTDNGPPGVTIRPIAATSLQHLDLNGTPALLIDDYKISWYVDDHTAVTILGQGITTDELIAIARATRPGTTEDWLDKWNRVPIRRP